MRLWLENRRLYGTGGINGKSVNNFNLQDIRRIEIDPDVVIPEHYKRVLVKDENERKAAFRKLLKEHGVKIEGRYNPDLFTYFLSVLRARAPYTIEGAKKAEAKRAEARRKRAAKRRAVRERERNSRNAANGNANEAREQRREGVEEEVRPRYNLRPRPNRPRANR